MSNNGLAMKMRDVLKQYAREEVNKVRPAAFVARVVGISRSDQTVSVKTVGSLDDNPPLRVKYYLDKIPDQVGGIVRVEGSPGNYFVSRILSGDWHSENLKTRPYRPEQFGKRNDGKRSYAKQINDAMLAAESEGGGVVYLSDRYMLDEPVVGRSGVLLSSLTSDVKPAGGVAPAALYALPDFDGQWVFDTYREDNQGYAVAAGGINGVVVNAGCINDSVPDRGGIHLNAVWGTVSGCAASFTTLGSISVEGTANVVSNNGCQNFWQFRDTQPTDFEGALSCVGTDYYIEYNQANGGRGVLDPLPDVPIFDIKTSGNFFQLLTSVLMAGNGEFAHVGTRARLFECIMVSHRGDTNPGPGLHFLRSSFQGAVGGNQIIGLKLIANCLANTPTSQWSHAYIDEWNSSFDGITLGPDWTLAGGTPKNGIEDTLDVLGFNGAAYRAIPNKYNNIETATSAGRAPFRGKAIVRANVPLSYSNPTAGKEWLRPAANTSTGKTFYDTERNRLTISDGNSWRTADGKRVGNLFLREATAMDGDINYWIPQDDTCYNSTYRFAWTFGFPQTMSVKTKPAGVTAGFIRLFLDATAAAIVESDKDYQIGITATGPVNRANPKLSMTAYWFNSDVLFLGQSPIVTNKAIVTSDGSSYQYDTPQFVFNTQAVRSPVGAAFMMVDMSAKADGLQANDEFLFHTLTCVQGTGMEYPVEN